MIENNSCHLGSAILNFEILTAESQSATPKTLETLVIDSFKKCAPQRVKGLGPRKEMMRKGLLQATWDTFLRKRTNLFDNTYNGFYVTLLFTEILTNVIFDHRTGTISHSYSSLIFR